MSSLIDDPGIRTAEEAWLWRFILERAVHDLNNQLGGILSITDAHLARTIDDPELRHSLELINGGARAGRDLLLAMTEVLAAGGSSPELISLPDLLAYLHSNLKLFLPRRTELVARPSAVSTMVQVNPKALFTRLLILVGSELSNQEQPAWKGELALKTGSDAGWLIYRSKNRSGPAPATLCDRLFATMEPRLSAYRFRQGPGEFEAALGLKIVRG